MARKFAPNNIIKFLDDKDGSAYGPENNPKRKGSKAHAQFALYHEGMTIEEAYAAGITTAELTYDVEHDFITVTSNGAAKDEEEEPEHTTAHHGHHH